MTCRYRSKMWLAVDEAFKESSADELLKPSDDECDSYLGACPREAM